jgi:hypothetical protein
MRVRRILGGTLAALATALVLAGGAGAQSSPSVAVDRGQISAGLGETFSFQTTIANRTPNATEPLIAHLNILSLSAGLYVDPEDWSSERTQYLGPIPARGSRTITWKVKAVNGGRLAAYVAVLPEARPARPPATSPTIQVTVAERKPLDSGGILPLALGVPAMIALLAGGVGFVRRRR